MDFSSGSEELRDAYGALVRAILKQAPAASPAARPKLRSYAEMYGAHKGHNCNSYEIFLHPIRDEAINLLEIGIGGHEDDATTGGGSLRMWRDYFPHATIFGIDLFDKSPHAESRIHIRRGSQDDREFLRSVAEEMQAVDVIVDDGSHISSHVILSFECLFPYLKSGGVYIVEDIATSYWPERGGSRDLDSPTTSMNYFKRIADGVQWPHSQGVIEPNSITRMLEFVHFGNNFVVLRKL